MQKYDKYEDKPEDSKESLIGDYFESKKRISTPYSHSTYANKERIYRIVNITGWSILIILYTITGAIAIGGANGILTMKRMLEIVGYNEETQTSELLELSKDAGGTFLNELPMLYENKELYILLFIIIPILSVIILTILFLIARYFLERKLFTDNTEE